MDHLIFNKNIEAIKSEDNLLKQIFLKQELQNDNHESIRFGSEVIADKQVIYSVLNEKVYQLGSLYDDEVLTECWFGQIEEWCFNSKLLMFGIGNGMYVRKFLSKVPETEGIIVYEPSFVLFRLILETIDLSDILSDPRVHIFVEGMDGLIAKDYLYQHINYSDIKGLIFHDYLNYKIIFEKEFVLFFRDCQTLINSINATNIVWERFGESYYSNTMHNISHFLASKSIFDLYYKLPKGIPAIIVAAGPSLDRNVSLLHEAKGKAFIIAVDSALKALLKNGVCPDIFVTIDGQKMQAHFDDFRIKEIPMVCNFNSNTTVLDKHTGDKYFINDLNPHINKILASINKKLPVVSSGGSVANTAFSLAELLGFTTIIMIGQDLAYTDNRTHAIGTVRGDLNIDITKEDYIEVEGYYGDRVRSSNEFWLYLDWFQKEIELNKDIKVINSTEGGARILGAVQMSLKEAIKQECMKSLSFVKEDLISEYFLNKEEFEQFIINLIQSESEMNTILLEAEKAIRIHRKMLELIYLNKYKSTEFIKLFQKTKEIRNKIENLSVMYYIECRIQSGINKLTNDIYSIGQDEYAEVKEATQKGLDYFRIIAYASKVTIPEFKQKIRDGIEQSYLLRKTDT